MLLNEQELSVITLKSPFVYEHGDLSRFMQCMNGFPLQFFVRYRSSQEDPSQYRWSRVLKVVRRQAAVATTGVNAGPNPSLAEVGSSAPVVPLRWKEKKFLIALVVEGEEKCVELPRLSSNLPTEKEVIAYCVRRAGRDVEGENEGDTQERSALRKQLPTSDEIQKLRAFRQKIIENHQWTPEDIEQARELNEEMGRVGASSVPARLTVNAVSNMQLESQLSIASSHRAVDHLAAAMERRNAVSFPRLQSQLPAGAIQSQAPLSLESQLTGDHQYGIAISGLDGSPQLLRGQTPELPPNVLQEVMKRWEECARHEEKFYRYVSNDERSAYLNKIASITQRNYEKNKQDRLRGIANERRLDRKSNLVESGGLWIVDDKLRAQLAAMYRSEQDGEAAAAVTSAEGRVRNGKKDLRAREDAGNGAKESYTDEVEAMVQRFKRHYERHQLSFVSVLNGFTCPEDNDSLSTTTGAREDGFGESGEHKGATVAHGAPTTGRARELLFLSSNPKMVRSQLLHRVASENGRMSLKRRHFSSTKSSPPVAPDEAQ
uniref:Uncharacterized protein n=1 Tax=Trypanosoma congolense (strain IL3000) TaxID=1068625 RepID=G0UQ50_TRYCI|nr:conserved hypothetical protein [Trypanosoma congolense IL3000]